MFRVFYNRVYKDSKDAERDAKKVSDYSPRIKTGKGSWFIELGTYRTRQEADSAYFHFRGQGLRVFIQEIKG